MSSRRDSRDGAFRHQDGAVIVDDHPQYRWNQRAPSDWYGYNVRAAWREATEVDYHAVEYPEAARYHPPSGMLLISCWGILRTVKPLYQQPVSVQRDVLRQHQEARGE